MSETSLESLSTERLLATYLIRDQLSRDCEPILAEARRRDAELAQLRAELERLKPLADAAVAFYCNDGSPDHADALNEAACGFGAYFISAQAQAQAREGV